LIIVYLELRKTGGGEMYMYMEAKINDNGIEIEVH
jgi:hypothetical protein